MRDVWLVVLALAACGDDRRYAVDAGLPDGPTGLVTVRYVPRDGSSPGGTRVYFQRSDSSLILATRMFQDGTANAFMPDGGFVTIRTSELELWTWGGVTPGDELVLGTPPVAGDDRIFNLGVTADPAAESYWLHTSCGEVADVTGAENGLREVSVRTCGTGIVDLLLVTRPPTFQMIAHYSLERDVAVPQSGTLRIDAPLVPAGASVIHLTSVPSRFGYFYARQELRGRDHGTLFDSGTFGTALIDSGQGAGMTTIGIPRPPDATLVTYVDDTNTNSNSSLLHLVDWAPASEPVTIAVDQRLVRSFVGQPVYLPESNGVVWGESTDGMLGEAVSADLLFNETGLRWHVLAPRTQELIGQGGIRVPVLPDPDLQPLPTGSMRTIGLISIRADGGYDGYRESLLGWMPGDRWPIVGPAGRAQWSEMAAGVD